MSIPHAHPVTLEAFQGELARSDIKLELIEGVIYAFAGGSVAHDILTRRILDRLTAQEAPPCRAYTSNMAVQRADAPTHIFPDASFSCEDVALTTTKLLAPRFVLEVISPESVLRDKIDKQDQYFAIGSIEEYLLIDSRQIWVRMHRRTAASVWTVTTYGRDERFDFASVPGVTVAVNELYAGMAGL